jgi:hypothetical protein
LLKYYSENWYNYDDTFVFYPATKYLNRSLCIHKEFYYTRPPLYEKINESYPAGCKYDGKELWDVKNTIQFANDSFSYCDENSKDNYVLEPKILNTVAYLSKNLRCMSCMKNKYGINTR